VLSTFKSLIRELRRRRVFRTAALYVVGAWLVLQIADVSFPGFGIPEAAIGALIWAAVIGFPVAIVFGWFFDIGSDGIRRTSPVGAASDDRPLKLTRSDYVVLAAFAAVAAVIAYGVIERVRHAPDERDIVQSTEQTVIEARPKLDHSIAVLPFTNISNDPDNDYFCDGISEEILNQLSQVGSVNVIGRTSSFVFREGDYGVARISDLLGVRYVLQGSVRKAGNDLRIAAQLLDDTGLQIWAATFDRRLDDVFAIQSEIAEAVVATVASHLSPVTRESDLPDIEAYTAYLEGRELLHRRDTLKARTALAEAIALDPGFAAAYAELAISHLIGLPSQGDRDTAREAIDRALALKPDLLRAQAAKGLWLLGQQPPDAARAEVVLRAVLAREPSMSDALLWLSNSLFALDRGDEAVEILRKAIRVDPLHATIAVNLAGSLHERGDSGDALLLLERQIERPDPPWTPYLGLRDLYHETGQLVALNASGKKEVLSGAGRAYYTLVLSYGLLADWSMARYWAERSSRDNDSLLANDLFEIFVLGWRGRFEEAVAGFERIVAANGVEIAEQSASYREWLGWLFTRVGRHADAIELLEPLYEADPVPDLDPWGETIFGPHALAIAYRGVGDTASAAAVLSTIDGRCRALQAQGRLRISAWIHTCAENALLRGEVEQSLDRLERAVEAGWRDYYLREHDPVWNSLQNEPRYRTLMARVKADVDRQRVEVERLDAQENFIAKLDAVMAERGGSGE
jgi:TolB-like protein